MPFVFRYLEYADGYLPKIFLSDFSSNPIRIPATRRIMYVTIALFSNVQCTRSRRLQNSSKQISYKYYSIAKAFLKKELKDIGPRGVYFSI